MATTKEKLQSLADSGTGGTVLIIDETATCVFSQLNTDGYLEYRVHDIDADGLFDLAVESTSLKSIYDEFHDRKLEETANTITLKDLHSEGSGGVMSVDFEYLRKNTIEWLDAKDEDFWDAEESLQDAKNNLVHWIVECYEHEQQWESIDDLSIKDFCEREIKNNVA